MIDRKIVLEILAFGITKEVLKARSIEIELKEPLNIAHLKELLLQKYPELGDLNSLAIAVNSEYAEDETQLSEHDEVALIPPVSGG